MKINEYILKLTGKASLTEPLEIGKSYRIIISGDITSQQLDDNNDGTVDQSFKFVPVLVGVVTPEGKTLKAKGRGSQSQVLRNIILQKWDGSGDRDEFYQKRMSEIIAKENE